VTLAATLLFSIWLAAAPPDDAPRAAQRVFREFEYQRDLFPPDLGTSPTTAGGRPSRGPTAERDPQTGADKETWSREDWPEEDRADLERYQGLPDARGWPDRRPRESVSPEIGGRGLATFLKILLWMAAVAGVLAVVLSLIRNRRGAEARLAGAAGEASAAPTAELGAPRTEAERLADAGRYDEAVHVLLLKTIEALVSLRPGGLPESWTSREIERGLPIPDGARPPFGDLVGTVEQSLFGGRAVGQDDWLRCRDRFNAFEQAYRAGRA
jgi:hypothetical protein